MFETSLPVDLPRILCPRLSTDLDGGFGTEQTPCDLDTIVDLQRVPDMLRQRGYKPEDVEGIMFANWVRFFREAWG